MTTQTKIRRGTASQCDAMTPAEGEVIYDMTNDRLRVGDGVKAGGYVQASAADILNGAFISGATTASGNDLTVAIDPAPAAYAARMTVIVQPPSNTTGGTKITARINALSYVDVYKISGGAVVLTTGNEMVGGGFYTLRHNGTYWVLESSGGDVASVTGVDGIVVSPTSGAVTVGLDTANGGGVGSYAWFYRQTGTGSTANNATELNSRLNYVTIVINTGGSGSVSGVTLGANPSGTWRNVSGITQAAGAFGLWQRTA